MNTSLVKNGVKHLQKVAVQKSPSILTAIGVVGLITTVILAIKATPKALEILDEEKKNRVDEFQKTTEKPLNFDEQDAARKLTPVEIAKLTWKCYIPTTVVGFSTAACIIGANSMSIKRQAALASLYGMAQEAMNEYQSKVVEQIGKNKEEKIRSSVDQDKLDRNPINPAKIIITGKGKSLFFDTLSSRYFESDIEEIRKRQNDFNFRLINDFYRPLNEWYDDIGLEPMALGNDMGWRSDIAKLNIYFDTRLVDDKAVIILNYNPLPIPVL